MRRALVLALALLAATPAAASAQLGQVEPLTLRGDDACVRSTGAPGELALPATGGVRLAQATREGVRLGRTVAMGKGFECAAAVSRPGGAGVLAGTVGDGVVISVRAPGGDWAAPVTIPVSKAWRAGSVAAAASDRGDVIVTWREDSAREGVAVNRFRVVRAAPGAPFEAAETLGAESRRNELVVPAIAGTGEAFVLTTTSEGSGLKLRSRLSVHTAAPGAPFGAPAVLGTGQWLSTPAIDAAADGRVLVAFSDGTSQRVAERAPGGAFAPSARIGDARENFISFTFVRLGATGEAVVAWARYTGGDVQFATRPAPGPFGAPARVGARVLPKGYDPFLISRAFFSYLFGNEGAVSDDESVSDLVLTGDGRGALAWFGGGALTVPTLLTTPIAGGAVSLLRGGQGLEAPQRLRALTLADGSPALVWTETVTSSTFKLHLAAEGVAERPDPTPPRVTIGAPRSRTVSEDAPLRLPVRCDRPCEVHASFNSVDTDVHDYLDLGRAGRGVLTLRGAELYAPARRGPVRLTISSRAPGALHAQSRTVTVRIARAANVPFSRATHVRAVRAGGSIRVSWRTAGRQDRLDTYFVAGTRTRALGDETLALRAVDVKRGRRAHSVTLRAGREVRFVTVRTVNGFTPRSRATVPVR